MLTLNNNALTVSFPEVHPDATCTISFHRTLRVPDDNRTHHLPPSLGRFRLSHVDDYASRLPTQWYKRGGVFLPMHQTEAMWIDFTSQYPFAVKVAAGKVNAITGKPWSTRLEGLCSGTANRFVGNAEQDYLSIPQQPWLDGFCVDQGRIRQFVAMALGDGYTAEEQLSGEAAHGGLQLIVYPLRPKFYKPSRYAAAPDLYMSLTCQEENADMGLAPGGLMKQVIHRDEYGVDKFDQSVSAKCFVHLLNSKLYESVTGKKPPHPAPTAADYTAHGLPWFAVNDSGAEALPGAAPLKTLDSIANLGNKLGENPLPENEPLTHKPKVVPVTKPQQIREGEF